MTNPHDPLQVLREASLPAGFEDRLQARLLGARQKSPSNVIPFVKKPRVLWLLVAIAIPTAAAAAASSHWELLQEGEVRDTVTANLKQAEKAAKDRIVATIREKATATATQLKEPRDPFAMEEPTPRVERNPSSARPRQVPVEDRHSAAPTPGEKVEATPSNVSAIESVEATILRRETSQTGAEPAGGLRESLRDPAKGSRDESARERPSGGEGVEERRRERNGEQRQERAQERAQERVQERVRKGP